MTADQFRHLALDLPDAAEGTHMGHPDFRAANGRIFASLHGTAGGGAGREHNERMGMVALTPEEQAALLASNPETFQPSAGAWGRQGYTDVILETADRRAVRAALQLAWERIAAKPRTRKKVAGAVSRPASPPRKRRTP